MKFLNNYSFENLWKAKKSSFLGLLILFCCLGFVWYQKATFLEVSPAILFILHFLFTGKAKDTNNPLIILLIVSFTLLLFSSCKPSFYKCKELYGQHLTDTQLVRFDTLIKREIVSTSFIFDTLPYYKTMEEQQGRAKITVVKNGKELSFFGECDTIKVETVKKVPFETVVFKEKEIFIEKPFFQTWQSYAFIISGLINLFLLYLIAKIANGKATRAKE